MRGDLRVRLTRLLRERQMPVPEYQGVTSFRVTLKHATRGKDAVRTAESDDFFTMPASNIGFIVEVHRKADDWKLHHKCLTYLDFKAQGDASYLGVRDLKILVVSDSPDRVQKLLRLIGIRMAWFVDQAVYLQEYGNLARRVWVDPTGDYHSLLD